MTVSPQWPQDGNRQRNVVGNGVESDSSFDSPTLPPTLFELPNLGQEARGNAHTDSDPPAVNQPPVDQAPPHPIFQDSSDSDDEPRSPIPPAVSSIVSTPASTQRAATAPPNTVNAPDNSRAPKRIPIHQNQPAGRSWMERIGSHSVVVVLLLVVIAAGLVIGRNSRHQGSDSSLANSSDLLDFDEGTDLDLPLPKHVYKDHSEIPAIAEAESSAQPPDPGVSSLEPAVEVTNKVFVAEVANSPSPDVVVDGGIAASDTFANSAATLSDPRTDLAATGEAGNANRVEVNKVNEGSTQVDFIAASNRTNAETSQNTLPTLDDLDDQSAGAGDLTIPDAKTPAPQLSKTPAPIIDWRLYLPREQPATADQDVPLTSN